MKQFCLLIMICLFCSCDDTTLLPPYTPLIYLEDFENARDNTPLNINGFTNTAETGISDWTGQVFDGNGYTEFLSESDTPSAAWLITPPVDLGTIQRTLHFQAAQHHLPQQGSQLEAFIATDYNGTDIGTAHWVKLPAKTSTVYNEWYAFISSGEISLAGFSGKVHIAFRAAHTTAGSGYYIDNVKLY